MSDIAQRLTDRRNNVWEQMKSVAERAVEEKRNLSAEEQGQIDAMNTELDDLDKRITSFVEADKRAKEHAAAFAKPEGDQRGGQKATELRQWARGESGSRALEIAPGGLMEFRADQTTSNAAGVIPAGFRAQLWEYLIEESAVLSAGVDLLETASGETIKLPRATVHSTAASQTEATTITASDPTLNSVDSTVTKDGYLFQVSTELVQDAGVDLEGYFARAAGRALGNAIGAKAVTAAVAAATAGATTATGELTSLGAQSAAGKGYDYLVSLFYSVIAPYRNRNTCSWLMSDLGAKMVRLIKDADGMYVWRPATAPGQPDTIEGKPVHIDTNVADPGASAKSILFGDFSSVTVRIAGGFRFERSDDFAFDSDLITYRALTRTGSVSKDANALKALVHAAS